MVPAQSLRDSGTIESAFAAYEQRRRARVERVVEQGQRTGGWKALGPIARLPRDLIMSLAMKRMARTGNDPSQWVYDHHIEWDEPVRSAPLETPGEIVGLFHPLTVEHAKRVERDRGENAAADAGAAEQLHPPGDGDEVDRQ